MELCSHENDQGSIKEPHLSVARTYIENGKIA